MIGYLPLGKVIQWEPENVNGNPVYERILWTDPANDELIVINVKTRNALPKIRRLNETLVLLDDGCAKILDFYQKEIFALKEDSIPEKWKIKRNKAWSVISDIVKKEPDIYYENLRGHLVKETMVKHSTTKPSIYNYLRKYWQGGQIENCLLPSYFVCGGKGSEKNANGKKRGRTRKSDKLANDIPLNSTSSISNENDINKSGININKKVRKYILRAVKDYYKTTVKYPLKHTYEKMIYRDFAIGYQVLDGLEVPVLRPAKDLPTFGQFKYWVKKDTDIKDIITSREGNKGFNLRHRQILGKSTSQAYGPGSRFQIDATHASVYLVNSLTRTKVIKRATIYVIIDVFSRMITGLYVGLENPSWIGASIAIANAATDKVEYCKNYDIKISSDQWPCTYLPDLITADRGELEGNKPNNLINCLEVDAEILPPYRADWKGIVESEFRKLDIAAILWLPGAIQKRFRERGEKDYRLGAALTLKEFTKILINCVLFYNNVHRMNSYDRNEFQIADKVPPIPIKLWGWGMSNRTGRLHEYPEDIVKLNLMLSAEATVTHKGIRLGRKFFYTCSTAENENWFIRARSVHSWKVPVSFDPRKMEYLYIRLNDGMDYEKCFLLESSFAFKDKYYEEVEEYDGEERIEQEKSEYEELQEKAILDAKNTNIVTIAKVETTLAALDISDRQKISDILDSTADENAINQKKEALELKDKHNYMNKTGQELIKKASNDNTFEYIPAQSYVE